MLKKTLKIIAVAAFTLIFGVTLASATDCICEPIIAYNDGKKTTIVSNNGKDVDINSVLPLIPCVEGEFSFRLCSYTPTQEDEKYNPNNYPKQTYSSALDAYYAFSMIDSVSQTVVDGNMGYTVKFANQGKMKEEFIEGDVEIISTSDSTDALLNSSAQALKRGDIVFFDRTLDGKIKTISLIMRPPTRDIVKSSDNYGNNFELLFSDDGYVGSYNKWTVLEYGNSALSGKGVTQYAFGVSGFKLKNTLYLLNKSGDLSSALEIFMNDNASVYVCDFTSRGSVEIDSVSSINSNITQKQFYNGGIVSFDEASYSYALIRMVDGIAVDIAYYIY